MAHGRYTIVGKLADGGMAEIFLALQHGAEGFQKPVALKRVLSAFSADPQFRNMFLDEAHISMSLSHGNIVQVLDVGVAGERTFLVLELVEGWDLERVMERAQATGPDHPWPPSLALYVTAEICRGLAYAHAKRGPDGRALGIVHRDVSPTNVLISEQGEVKLADFGIAKAEKKREQTLAGVIKGKIGFMSPEQALGRPLDARADLFSVGTVMYLMLTGRRPFDAGSELESMTKAQRAEYRPPEELNPYLSREATAIVAKAMRRDPDDRYQTADEILVDVERVLRGEYHSAGQTELKRWLADLAGRDGVAPMGRQQPPAEGDARPVFVDEHGDLSAGSSVELSDLHGSWAPTAAGAAAATAVNAPVAISAESKGAPGGAVDRAAARLASLATRPSPASSSLAAYLSRGGTAATSVTPATVEAAAVTTSAAVAAESSTAPAVKTPSAAGVASAVGGPSSVTGVRNRLPRRSRVGLGFVLGAVCMLGAVFGIRWLAQWAGREHIALPPWSQGGGEAAPSPPTVAAAAPTAAGVTPEGAAAVPAPAAGVIAAPAATPATVSTPDGATTTTTTTTTTTNAAASAAIEGDAGTIVSPGAATPAPSPGTTPATADLDDDEDRLIGRMVPDPSAVIGEDDAEENAAGQTRKQTGKPGGAATPGKSARQPVGGAPLPLPLPPPAAAGDSDTTAPRPPPARAPVEAGGDKAKGVAARAATKPAPRAQPVQVRITTSPLGAVVRTKKRVLGRTPLAIRFNPGNVYELTFVKRGYVTHSRRLAVATGKPKSISVAMKKKPPPPRRSSFFGGR
ncbi:MAG: serine/threonine-protein kinase [Bacteroidota bacterium]